MKSLKLILLLAVLFMFGETCGQKVKTKLITYRGITMKVPETAPDLNTQDATASLKVSDQITMHFRIMPYAANTEQAAQEHGEKYWETKAKARGIPMQMELGEVSFYFIPGEDAKGNQNYLLAGATAHEEFYGIYVVYGDAASAKQAKKALRSIRKAKNAPEPVQTPEMEMKEVSFNDLKVEVPQNVKVKEVNDLWTLTFDNMYTASVRRVRVADVTNSLSKQNLDAMLDKAGKINYNGSIATRVSGWQAAMLCYKHAGESGTLYVDNRGKFQKTETGRYLYRTQKFNPGNQNIRRRY